MRLGFIGLGLMGKPMALNLARSGAELLVWNRTEQKSADLAAEGAIVAKSLDQLFEQTSAIFLMLKDAEAIDAVLGRSSPDFERRVCGKMIIQTGTVEPAYSVQLAHDIAAVGGRYVEAPVSGSRGPAEQAELVVMLAGTDEDVASAEALIAPLCAASFRCGNVPQALQMKLAVNHYLITMVTSLCEAFHFADRAGLDLELLHSILNAGPMASAVSDAKLTKLVKRDFSPQASLEDVLKNADLVLRANQAVEANNPLLQASHALLETAVKRLGPSHDMAGVIVGLGD